MDIDGIYYCSRCMRKVEDDTQVCPHCGYAPANVTVNNQHLAEGTFLNDRYLLGAVIGAGGFGVTYAAWDENLSVPVALKEYFPVKYAHRNTDESDELLPHEESRGLFALGLSRFRKEAQVLAQFQNVPGIVNITECFDENETAYIAMEFVHGVPLDVYVREHKPSPKKLLDIMLPAINALEIIHRQGINHRDIKPENLLVQEDGSIKLIDFGSAREVEHVTNLIVVSDGYAPLEQYDLKQPQGPWVDVYGVSATIYHMLTGVMPEASISRAKHDTLKAPSKLGVKLKKYQETALMAGLTVDPRKRIQSIAEFRALLYNMPLPEEVRRRKAFVRRVVAVVVLLLLMMAAVFVNFAIGFPLGEGLLYSLYPDGWHVMGVAEERAKVAVPGNCLGLPVRVIETRAFRDSEALVEVVIPGSVKEIVPQSFSNCTALTTVTLEVGVQTIDYLAFSECTALHSIYLPDTLKDIEPSAFDGTSEFLTVWCSSDVDFDTVLSEPSFSADIEIIRDIRPKLNTRGNIWGSLYKFRELYYEVHSLHLRTSIHTGKTGRQLFLNFQDLYYFEPNETGLTLTMFCYDDWACFAELMYMNIGNLLFARNYRECDYCTVILPSFIDGQPVTAVAPNALETVYSNEYHVTHQVASITFPYYMKTIHHWLDGKLNNMRIDLLYSDEVQFIADDAFYGARIDSFVFPSKLKAIGDRAFEKSSIVSVELPDELKSIGRGAFQDCTSLKSVKLSPSLKAIANSAFHGCYELNSVLIPEGVESIEQSAFSDCEELKHLWLPETIQFIDRYSFSGSGVQYLHVPPNARLDKDAFDSFNGIIAGEPGTEAEALAGSNGLRFGDISRWNVFPDEDVPGSVTIDINNVENAICASFDKANNVPVTRVGTYARAQAVDTWVQNVNAEFRDIYPYLLGLPDTDPRYYTPTVTLKSVEFPLLAETIMKDAFANTVELTNVVFPATIRRIDNGAFSESGVKEVMLPFELKTPLAGVFHECTNLTFTIPDGVTSIGNNAFESCDSLTSIIIPDSVTSIGDRAFKYCDSLTSIIIPDSVTSIGDEAFADCDSLTSIIIPDNVTSIGDGAFMYCDSLTSIIIPDGVTSIGPAVFRGCPKLNSITVSPDHPTLETINGVLFDKATKRLICYPAGMVSEHYTMPQGIQSIGEYAFWGCDSLTSIIIPNSVTSIGDNAFRYCSTLASITIPDSMTSIGDYAFADCRALTSIIIPDSVTAIGDNVFADCRALTSIIIPDSVTAIGDNAFAGCIALTSITIPDSVTSIGIRAFMSCIALTNITIPDSVTEIGNTVFWNCSSLKSVRLPAGITCIEYMMFEGCESLTTFMIPDGVTRIDDSAFAGCSSLTSITIPNGVTSIDDSAFEKCSSLASITIPDSVTSIDEHLFNSCSRLTSIIVSPKHPTLETVDGVLFDKTERRLIRFPSAIAMESYSVPQGTRIIGAYAFSGCESLKSITLPDGVTSIGKFAFEACSSLTSIAIPCSVTSIEDAAFSNCSSLTSVIIPRGVTNIGRQMFFHCKSLTSITIPEGVTSIGESAFKLCSSLRHIMLPDSLTSIGGYAFMGCHGLTSVTIPDGVTSIEVQTFAWCNSLRSIKIPDSVLSIHDNVFTGYDDSIIYTVERDSYAEWYCQQKNNRYIYADNESD